MKTININCRFCNTPMGQQTLPNVDPGQVVTLDDLNILDARCDSCGPIHGNFKEMSIFYNDNVSEDPQEQKDFFIKSEYKISKYVDNLIFDHPEAIFGGGVSDSKIKEIRDQKVIDIGIEDLGDSEKIKLINTYKENYTEDVGIDSLKVDDIKQAIIEEREK